MSTKIRKLLRRQLFRRQKGAAAIELALVLPIMLVLLMAPLFLAVFFWHYTAAQKAAQNGARYLSTISEQEMRIPALAAAAKLQAENIIRSDLAELFPKGSAITITPYCGESASGVRNYCTGLEDGTLPANVEVGVQFRLKDDLFKFVNTGRFGWNVSVLATVPYAGN